MPKEEGWYFIHWKHPDDRLHTQIGHQYYDESIKGLWFGKDWFDWYLQEVPQSNDKAIIEKQNELIGRYEYANANKIPFNTKYLQEIRDEINQLKGK